MHDAKNKKKPPRIVDTIVGVARATANYIIGCQPEFQYLEERFVVMHTCPSHCTAVVKQIARSFILLGNISAQYIQTTPFHAIEKNA